MSNDQISITNLSKIYDNGFEALKKINLNIKKGEIFAMLGPNGAGKTSLISIICGIVKPTSGKVTVDGYDIIDNYRETRSRIGLVPQELTLESFETVFNNVSYTRGLYGKAPKPSHIEKILKDLSLWDKKDQRLRQLSGGMKRRVLIAKALSHEPDVLFLDEPTAGVDVELRKDMWKTIKNLQKSGVTIILTTHYIEEAELMANRIAVINNGKILLIDKKDNLIDRMSKKTLTINTNMKINKIDDSLFKFNLRIGRDKKSLEYDYSPNKKKTGITSLLNQIKKTGIELVDVQTKQSSLEQIFVEILKND
jgi:ABC-2 type transport system ATP-binding protein